MTSISEALILAQARHPFLRVGQLIFNALEAQTNRETNGKYDGIEYRKEFHARLFYIEDHRLIQALEAF